MIAEAWETRVEGPLVFSYQPDSYVEQHLDSIVASYQKALADVSAFLGVPSGGLPRISIYLCEFLPEVDGQAGGETRRSPDAAEIWTTVNSESPGADPEVELAQLLLHKTFGPATRDTRFWYDGLAGYLAGKNGSSEYHAEAPARVQKLFDAGQLPPLVDLLALYGIRQSATGTSSATAFVGYLVDHHGVDRFKRFLAALRQGNGQTPSAGVAQTFQRVYGRPLQSVEQSWYRVLEASGAGGGAKMSDAVKQLVPYMKTYRLQLLGIFGCILVTISFAIFLPLSIRFLVNSILARRPLAFPVLGIGPAGYQLQVGDEQTHALLMLLGAMIFFFVLSAVSNARRSYLVTSMGEGVNYDLRMRFYNQLQRLPIAYHRSMPNQDITQRFWTDVTTVSQALTLGIVPITQATLAMLIFGTVLISLNFKLSLIALAGLPIFAFSFQRMRAKLREAVLERTRRQSEISQTLVETLNAPEKIRLYRIIDYLADRFAIRMALARDHMVRITEMASTATSTSALITNGAQVLVLIIGGLIVIDSQQRDLTTGDLMAFYVLLLQFYAPAATFTGAMQFINQATTSVDRVNSVLNQKAEQDAPDAVEVGPLRDAIRFDAVSHGRGKGKDLVKDLTLEIKAGSKVAFVGPPGAGKASLMELLPRLSEVAGGAITWDGVDVRKIKVDSLRRQMAVVSQETYVFRATVYDNIRYGRVDATDEEVIRAAQQAGLHEFILGLPGGYDTQLNDRDAAFGLVQRQRLTVARALLQDAPVIVMDDALSALDAPGQRELEDALRPPGSGKTLIRVAQRIGSVLDADEIFVMDSGQLAERGRHDTLSDAGGLYMQLLKDELGAGAVSGAFQAVRRLARQAPFSALPAEVLEEVARLMLYAERSTGDVICRQGSVGDELFVLGRGEVEVVLEDEDGHERIIGSLSEGEYFGEISFLRRVPRTATVRARTQTELHILRRQDFDQLLERLGSDLTAHLDRTAQERIDATRAKLAAAEAAPA
jgi:ABC-type multidrug transport system fused ATPase/permease subunit